MDIGCVSKFGTTKNHFQQKNPRCCGGDLTRKKNNFTQSMALDKIMEGCRLPVKMGRMGAMQEAEILATKVNGNETEYYVHYLDFNRRLDEWVPETALDFESVVFPVKNKAGLRQIPSTADLTTGHSSRASTPEKSQDSVTQNGHAAGIGRLKSNVGRKRKHPLPSVPVTPSAALTPSASAPDIKEAKEGNYCDDVPDTPVSATATPVPRATGSMSTHHGEDAITRIREPSAD